MSKKFDQDFNEACTKCRYNLISQERQKELDLEEQYYSIKSN